MIPNLITYIFICYNICLVSLLLKLGYDLWKDSPIKWYIFTKEKVKIIKYINEYSKKLFKKLQLPAIPILFDKEYDNCHFGRTKKYPNFHLMFGLKFLDTLKNNKLHTAVYGNKHLERVYFVIAHEMAHYLQYHKHKKWHDIFEKGYSVLTSIALYRKQKLESNANKIAEILLKKYQNAIIK